MYRPGVSRIQVIRDERTGKAKELKPLLIGASDAISELQSTRYNVPAGISPDDISAAWGLINEACNAAGARPDLMPPKGVGRLLAIVAEKVSRGDGAEAREALLEEAKDLVAAIAGAGVATAGTFMLVTWTDMTEFFRQSRKRKSSDL